MTLLYCFDNFYYDPDAVREYALSLEYESLENIGSIGPIQDYNNLNKDFSSDFVCAKSCYGYENVAKYLEFLFAKYNPEIPHPIIAIFFINVLKQF